ncbi:MBL fold metallo-hydrolase [Planktomarina temperata]|nr:MBL fold metallo-hydrolase [Planktomarina temperata]
MKVTHLQSSTQLIHLGDVKVLTDPWLTEGEYYGSWYHYPPFEAENIASLEYDYIYVSHIHPDHLSEKTFKSLPLKRPVLIHNYDAKFLKRKLEMLGFETIECDHAVPHVFDNGGSITIYAADNCNPELCGKFMGCGTVETKFGSTQIDTLALFEINEHSVLNTNDCPFELASNTIKAQRLHEKCINLLLVGYAGAGPYPQCFEFDTDEDKLNAAESKEKTFLKQAEDYINLVRPESFMPFAGTYTLGSRLAPLTRFRGVPTVANAVKKLNNAVSDVSQGIHLQKMDTYDCVSKTRVKSVVNTVITEDEYRQKITENPLDYDKDSWDDDELFDLVISASQRFRSKAEELGLESSTTLAVQSQKFAFQLSMKSDVEIISIDSKLVEPYVRIRLDHNLLHRLLRGPRYAHWNNAEIGSHLLFQRKPDIFERGLYHCMCFLHK